MIDWILWGLLQTIFAAGITLAGYSLAKATIAIFDPKQTNHRAAVIDCAYWMGWLCGGMAVSGLAAWFSWRVL